MKADTGPDGLGSANEGEPCTLRFCSLREGLTARVLWVDDGEEIEYGRLTECFFNQDTFVNHPWRLRDGATGQLLAEYCGPTATITLLPDGTTRVQAGLVHPPPIEVTDPRWGTFRRRGAALDCIPILAFDCVSQEAVAAAQALVESMLADTPPEVVARLAEEGAEVAIIGKDQVTTDLPMYRHLRDVDCGDGRGDYDTGTRGLGGNPGNPTTSCGEENLLMLDGDPYPRENILLHEFGHAVMDLGLRGNPLQDAILEAYHAAPRHPQLQHSKGGKDARAKDGGKGGRGNGGGEVGADRPEEGRGGGTDGGAGGAGHDVGNEDWEGYDPDCYMMANESEYWAEGTQAWFDATIREDVTSGVNTREKLKARDPLLAAILEQVYGDGEWRYPASAPLPFASAAADRSKRQRTSRAAGGGGNGIEEGREGAARGGGAERDHRGGSRGSSRGSGAGVSGGGSAESIQVLVQDNPLQPLLGVPGSSASSSGAARRSTRRRGGSPGARRGVAGGGAGGARAGRLAALPWRATRAFARLFSCCLTFGP